MKLHRLALWTGIGSGLEYYAFITFALQAKVLSILFFHQSDSALVNTFLIFAVGSVVTLFGGFFLGLFGDHLGRKKILLLSITLMTLSTVAIGLLPTDLPFGLSIALLVLCRLVQGASVGGEIPGAIVFVYEHAHKNQIGFLLGILFLGVGLGAGVSTGVNALVSACFSQAQILAFAWRIPFLLALFLGGAGYILRRKSTESLAFQAYMTQNESTAQTAIRPLRPLLLGAGLVFFPATLVSIGLYLPSYWMNHSTQNNEQIFLAMMLGFLLTALLLPLLGKLGDQIGRKKLYLWGIILSLLALPFLMSLLRFDTPWALYAFNLIYYLLIVIMAACYPAILASLFPIQYRYRFVALSYAGTYAIAGTAPFVMSLLIQHWNHPTTLLFFLFATGCISLITGLLYTPEKSIIYKKNYCIFKKIL